jgi:predicted small lipoprotein YifL
MKYVVAFMALAALAACGVDGAPIRPEKDRAQPPRNAPSAPVPGKWIGGTVSVHTGMVL